ncbi:Branchpoint-bridging protein [Diplonema papillatum]|nr:Branchpoint-bridging protein [Diplonema papillatum]
MQTAAPPKQSRWSVDRKPGSTVPVYVPSELFTVCKGQAMGVFMLRAAFADMNRMSEQKREAEWYAGKRKRDETPVYNAKGERVNTVQMLFADKKVKLVQDILAVSSRVSQKAAQSEARITKKIYFSKEQIQSRAYGAILGARGRTHQELQQNTGCKICLMGKGISDMLKNKNQGVPGEHRAGDDDAPHCHITAPTEEALKMCVERIEFIISDRKDAIDFRNEKRKEVAILNGTYREESWKQQLPQHGKTNPGHNPVSTAPQRNVSTADEEYSKFLNEIEGGGAPPAPSMPAPPPPQTVPVPPGMGAYQGGW